MYFQTTKQNISVAISWIFLFCILKESSHSKCKGPQIIPQNKDHCSHMQSARGLFPAPCWGLPASNKTAETQTGCLQPGSSGLVWAEEPGCSAMLLRPLSKSVILYLEKISHWKYPMGNKFCTFFSLLHRETVFVLFNTFEERIYGTKLHPKKIQEDPSSESCSGSLWWAASWGVQGPSKKGAVMKIDQVEWDNEGPQLTRG